MKNIRQYRLTESLGKGASGEVWKATDGQKEYAIKLFHEGLQAIGEEEFQALITLRHPQIIEEYEFDQIHDRYYLVMEYVEGVPLTEANAGDFSTEDLFRIVRQIAEGLKYAHDNGLIHRDIKPNNVLLTKEGDAKILDFGAATNIDLGIGERILEGTYKYMSAEQLAGKVNKQSDVWSFGIMLYEWLTGEYPFQSNSLEDLAFSFLQLDLLPPHQLNEQVPIDLSGIIYKCTQTELDKRYTDFGAVLQDLTDLPFSQKDIKALDELVQKKEAAYRTYAIFSRLLTFSSLMIILGFVVGAITYLMEEEFFLVGATLLIAGIIVSSIAWRIIKSKILLVTGDMAFIEELSFYLPANRYTGLLFWIANGAASQRNEKMAVERLRASIRRGKQNQIQKQVYHLLGRYPQNAFGLRYELLLTYQQKDEEKARKIAEELYRVNPDNAVHFFLDKVLNKTVRPEAFIREATLSRVEEATQTRMGEATLSRMPDEKPPQPLPAHAGHLPAMLQSILRQEKLTTSINLKEVNAVHLVSNLATIEWYEHYLILRAGIKRKNQTTLSRYFDKLYDQGGKRNQDKWNKTLSKQLITHEELTFKAAYSSLQLASLGGHYLEFDQIGYFLFEWHQPTINQDDYKTFIHYLIEKNGNAG